MFASLATQLKLQLEKFIFMAKTSEQMVFILQGTSRIGQHSASMQVFESLSIEMETNPKFAAKPRAQIIASASAWRGRVVFTLLEQANTTSPLQFLATAAMDELSLLQAASTLILIVPLTGLDQVDWILFLEDPNGISRTFLNSATKLEIFNNIPSKLGETP